MSAYRSVLWGLAFTFVVGTAGAAPDDKPGKPAKPAKPTMEQIDKWIEQLGDGEFTAREEATQKLWEAGRLAEKALEKAAESSDAEVRRRARELLAKFRWGIYPDSPAEVVEAINDYRFSDTGGKQAAVRKLVQLGAPGCRALAKLVTAEKKELRAALLLSISADLGRAIPELAAKKDYEPLEALLDVVLLDDLDQGARNYAAYWLMRGKLAERIAHHQDLLKRNVEAEQQREILLYLHRANGDAKATLDLARKLTKPQMIHGLLYERGKWAELAEQPGRDLATPVEKLGWQLALARLTGNQAKQDETVKALLAQARAKDPAGPLIDREQLFEVAKVLLINDRAREAQPLLVQSGHRLVLFEIHATQLKIPEALAVVDQARRDGSEEVPELDLAQARVLYSLGEKDKARAIFERYGKMIQPGLDESWFNVLVRTEARLGLKKEAFDHAARILATSPDTGWQGKLFRELFPDGEREFAAMQLWELLRFQKPGVPTTVTMKSLRDLLEGKAPAKDITALVAEADKRKRDNVPGELGRWLVALAEAAKECGHREQAQNLLKRVAGQAKPVTLTANELDAWSSITARAMRKLGDLAAERKDWVEAAQHYYQSWQRDTGDPLSLYLSGWALVQGGQKEAGQSRIAHAHGLPLGNEEVRASFLNDLVKRGLSEGASQEADWLLRVGRPGSFAVGEGLRQKGIDARRRDDYLGAALGQQQALLRCLQPFVRFVSPGAYAGVPAYIHNLRARGLLQGGKIKEALAEATLAQEARPGYVDLPILLLPELERRGLTREADHLFNQTLSVYEGLIKEYPTCAWAYNSAAWLCACCKRNLDRGLVDARKAVQLSPNNPSHLDTLAEVLFQMGKKEEAVATQKRVVELDPKRPYFRKQLARIEAGDPNAPRPDEEDE